MRVLKFLGLSLISIGLTACSTEPVSGVSQGNRAVSASPEPARIAPINSVPVVHVFVALCDNINQGIVPVSASLGNGDNPSTNLYWGAAFGIKTFFSKNKNWEIVSEFQNPQSAIMERVVFRHKTKNVFLVADAYRGREIKQTTLDFLEAAAGKPSEQLTINLNGTASRFNIGGSSDLLVYIGHNGLMDFTLTATPQKRDDRNRQAIILACASKQFFSPALKNSGASPLVWTTNLMAPEAYVLSAALDGWVEHESDEKVRQRAATAYHRYQNCGIKSAMTLFATGW
jgi:hypothetical protein